ncbi:hypothetical protein EAI_04934, partial [Harpegnathos saltator]
ELHIPGHQFCCPETSLMKRLTRGDQCINSLDAAFREHYIAYSRSNKLARHAADKILAVKTCKRITSKDSTLGEMAAAAVVWTAVKVKTK